MNSQFSQPKLLWNHPNPTSTRVDAFRRMVNRKHNLHLKDYHDLHRYSVQDYNFWLDLWHFVGIVYSVPPSEIFVTESSPETPSWFPSSRLNYAENLLHRNDDAIAITASSETLHVDHYTFRELRSRVKDMAAALRANGLQKGDRVAAIITNCVTAVVIALATASLGGIVSTTATDMGTSGILDRYRQIRPKFIFAETEVLYSGKSIEVVGKISEVVEDLKHKGLQCTVLLPSRVTGEKLGLEQVANSVSLDSFLASGDGEELEFAQLPFNHPLYILYSSGTSGPPKCIVHSAGGILLQLKKELGLGFNLTPDSTYFQYTTTAWMMWPFMVNALACGTRIVLYDGSPFHPTLPKFLQFISDQGVSHFGTSPRFLTEVQGKGIKPLDLGTFESLQALVVTGAVLTAPVFEWAHHAFGRRVHIISTSGGTDICAAFVTGVQTLPVYAGEIQGKSLGMKVEVFSPTGENIEETGEPGELVCTRPHVSLPIGFWGDESGEKYRRAYYDMYPGVWRQGDFMAVNPKTKGIMILGRSDGVLNPSGVRFGSGEIYTVLEQFSAIIDDTLCIGQRRPQDKDERVLLFVKMREGHKEKFDKDLIGRIKNAIRKGLSARHVPSWIFEVEDIPCTVNGKKIEIAVKQIVSGSDMKPSGTVANPESLQLYYKYRDLEQVLEGGQGPLVKARL